MVRNRKSRLNRSGFTLVELLIVVAIIGVLSTIGVPTFRRMVQKSKKSEAQVALGGLYTSEQAFFAEYGAFGNQIVKVGYQTDGTQNNYLVGFPTAACADQTAFTPTNTSQAATPIAYNLNQVFPNYYTASSTVVQPAVTLTSGVCGPALPAGLTTGLGGGTAVNAFNNTGEADAFIAVAVGVIAPGVNRAAPTALQVDIWGINNNRMLVNIQDGVL